MMGRAHGSFGTATERGQPMKVMLFQPPLT